MSNNIFWSKFSITFINIFIIFGVFKALFKIFLFSSDQEVFKDKLILNSLNSFLCRSSEDFASKFLPTKTQIVLMLFDFKRDNNFKGKIK